MKKKLVTIFGGSGFVGRHVVSALAKKDMFIRVACRRPDRAEFLRPRGNVGQITPVYADVTDASSVSAACHGADYVINLTGVLFEKGNQSYNNIHVQGACNIAEAATRHHCDRLIHVSAIGANPQGTAQYQITKAKGESAVKAHFEEATILRPSVVFGPEDDFVNRFAQMATLAPALPVFGDGQNKMQPVYVCDVADAIASALEMDSTKGKVFELGGPKAYAFKDILELITTTIKRDRKVVALPYWMGTAMGSVAQFLPKPPITADQVEMLKQDNTVDPCAYSFKDLDITPKSMEAIIPTYLKRFTPTI